MTALSRRLGMAAAALLAAGAAGAAPEAGLPGAYLNHAGGAAVTGMGRAYVGVADGIDAVAWNPAGLAMLRPHTLGLLHTQTAENAFLDYIGYAQPLYRLGGVGLGYIRLDSGPLPETDEFNREVGRFSDVQQTVMAGYGFNATRRLAFGGAFKFSRQSLSGNSASGWGADLGLLAQLPRRMRLGARIQNLAAPKFQYETASDQFPRIFTLGLAARLASDKLLLTWDVDKALDAPQGVQWRLGAEGTFFHVAKLRAGFDFQQKEFSFGLGYQWGRAGLDYSAGSGGAGPSHRLGATYAFGGYAVTMQAKPAAFSPVGLVKKTTLEIQVNHSRPVYNWNLQIKNQANDVVHTIRGSGAPPAQLAWDGRTPYGGVVQPGNYLCIVSVTDVDGRTETTPPQTVRVEYGTPLETLEIQTR